MHELALTQELVRVVLERASGRRVRRVVADIGRLAAVIPEQMRFCFPLCAEGTPAEGAEFELNLVPGRGRCRRCSAEVELESAIGRCTCGGSDLEWISGDELIVRQMEVD